MKDYQHFLRCIHEADYKIRRANIYASKCGLDKDVFLQLRGLKSSLDYLRMYDWKNKKEQK